MNIQELLDALRLKIGEDLKSATVGVAAEPEFQGMLARITNLSAEATIKALGGEPVEIEQQALKVALRNVTVAAGVQAATRVRQSIEGTIRGLLEMVVGVLSAVS